MKKKPANSDHPDDELLDLTEVLLREEEYISKLKKEIGPLEPETNIFKIDPPTDTETLEAAETFGATKPDNPFKNFARSFDLRSPLFHLAKSRMAHRREALSFN